MIDVNIAIAPDGAVNAVGFTSFFQLGYTKNRHVYRLHVIASGEWSGLTIRCFWHVPGGADPPASLVTDGFVDVPALVTSLPGMGCITFDGTDGEKRITSADLRYRVSTNSGIDDGSAPEPDSDSWQQFVDAVKGDADRAENAKNASEYAAKQAEKALNDTLTAKTDALTDIGQKKEETLQSVTAAAKPALTAAQEAKESASKSAQSASDAASSAGAAGKSAQDASASAAEATRQAELASQSAEGKGYLYMEDHDNSGILSAVIADSITDEITLRDDGAGILEVVYQ